MYTVDFSNSIYGESKKMIGDDTGVTIPDEYFIPGQTIFAWVVITGEPDSRETVYEVRIPISLRARPTDETPTPQQQSVIDQLISELDTATDAAIAAKEDAEAAKEAIEDLGVDAETLAAGSSATVEKTVDPQTGVVTLNFGIPRGNAGENGEGGVSPEVTVSSIPGGHRVNITDAEYPGGQNFDVMDGVDGEDGTDGVSPSITVQTITGGHRITITDADHPQGQSVDVVDGVNGSDGRGIVSIEKTGTSGLVDTYTITYTDNTTATFTVTNGADGQDGKPGPGVPAGGTTGQMLVKKSNTDYDGEWANQPSVPVQDVQINGTSILNNGVANVPIGSTQQKGVFRLDNRFGLRVLNDAYYDGVLAIRKASTAEVKEGTNENPPITPSTQHLSTFYGLTKAAGVDMASSNNSVGTYTEAAKSAISQMLNSPVTVSGTTPTITALPGIQYVCGEVSTLDITLPDSGIVDVIFQSGSTATVLTVTAPTGKTLSWANGFDPASLDAYTTYEINIAVVGDQCLGVAGAWT